MLQTLFNRRLLGCLVLLSVSVHAQWTDKVTDTPSLIQTDFGPYGEYLPGDGETYCGPTSATMSLLWLARNGFTQLGDPAGSDALNLDRVLGGLMGTTASGGTDEDGYYSGFMTYLNARGISPDQVVRVFSPNPDVAWLATNNFNQSVVNFSVGWFVPATPGQTTNYVNTGGHVLALLAVDPQAGTVTLNNAAPDTFLPVPNVPGSNPQTVHLAPVPADWTLPDIDPSLKSTQVLTSELGPNAGTVAVLWGGDSWTLSTNALTGSPGYAPQWWELTATQIVNSNGGELEVLAPVRGDYGFVKSGEGILQFQTTNLSTGWQRVTDGVLASSWFHGAPFGPGPITLSGDAELLVAPRNEVPTDLSLELASGPGHYLAMTNGAGVLRWDRGTNTSLTLRVGGHTNGTTANLLVEPPAALVLAPAGGLTGLGTVERLLVNGTSSNLPATTAGQMTAAIVGRDSDAGGSLQFLNYDETTGFQLATVTSSAVLPLDQSTSVVRYSADTPQTVAAGTTAAVRALVVNQQTVGSGGPGSAIQVGSSPEGDLAGVLLNSGTVEVDLLDFGSARAFVAVNGATNEIRSSLRWQGSLTTFGSGTLVLSGSNQWTAPLAVAGGTVVFNNRVTLPSAVVAEDATLAVTGTNAVLAGDLVLTGTGATARLNGGRVAGPLTATSGSVVEGWGVIGTNGPNDTVRMTNQVAGVVRGGLGTLTWAGRTVFAESTEYFWTLAELKDNADPGTNAWSQMRFEGPLWMKTTDVYLNFTDETDPDSGDPFWESPHTWTVWEFDDAYTFYFEEMNFSFAAGEFAMSGGETNGVVFLTFTPTPTVPTATIAESADGQQVIITFTGTLEAATTPAGPWSPVVGAVPPTYAVPMGGPELRFYRAVTEGTSLFRERRRVYGSGQGQR
ncbi:MAG: hypothetical protein J0M24_18660 [Verrucomicrobia bacterium]|nr:hypothetical protein [Verrucomicrobiota bacterium]